MGRLPTVRNLTPRMATHPSQTRRNQIRKRMRTLTHRKQLRRSPMGRLPTDRNLTPGMATHPSQTRRNPIHKNQQTRGRQSLIHKSRMPECLTTQNQANYKRRQLHNPTSRTPVPPNRIHHRLPINRQTRRNLIPSQILKWMRIVQRSHQKMIKKINPGRNRRHSNKELQRHKSRNKLLAKRLSRRWNLPRKQERIPPRQKLLRSSHVKRMLRNNKLRQVS